jgi:chaperonin GroEL
MVSDSEKMISEMKDAHILITDQKISSMKDLLPILEKLLQEGKKDLVIMAEDVD